MSIWTSGASRLTRSWVALYTLGLARDIRDSRFAEIASDLWEQQHDAAREGTRVLAVALSIIGRTLRGIPSDLLWRTNVEGPQMDIRIPVDRVMGGVLIGMGAFMLITAGVSGIDTRADQFESYFVDFADKSALENNLNALFRIITGLGLIAGAAVLFAALRDRSPILASIVGFGLLAAAALELVATSLQIVLVGLADEYVAAPVGDRESLLVSARSIALFVETTIGIAICAMLGSIYALAILSAREHLVPRWLIGLPLLSAGVVGVSLFMDAAGFWDDGMWLVLVGSGLLAIVWLMIAGFWLVFTPKQDAPATGPMPAGV
jgi:hypothetical protein